MKKRFLSTTVNFLKKYNEYTDEEIKKLNYGLEGLYLTLTKIVVIILLAFLLGIFKEVILILIFFNIIRFTGFGFHANKSWECLILSTSYFIIIPIIFLNINLSEFIKLIICLICIISYLLFAPADTVKRPLPNKKKRIIRKTFTVIIGIIYTTLIFIFPKLSTVLLSALVIQAIIINPLLYKLFGQPYNNYKNYIKT